MATADAMFAVAGVARSVAAGACVCKVACSSETFVVLPMCGTLVEATAGVTRGLTITGFAAASGKFVTMLCDDAEALATGWETVAICGENKV